MATTKKADAAVPTVIATSDVPPQPIVGEDTTPNPEQTKDSEPEIINDVSGDSGINPVITNVAPYLDPTGVTPNPVGIGEDVEYSPACPGAAGAKPVLEDVQRQLDENMAAARENRDPLSVRIRCLMCGLFHKEQQNNATGYSSMDDYGYKNVQKPADSPEPPTEFDLTQAAAAVNGSPVNDNDSVSGSTEEGTDSGSAQQDSGS